MINSGGKSLHAIVKVDAENSSQYVHRVRELYEFCKKNGLKLDEQDKNASRFSRLPGVKRGDKWQYIVERKSGAESYDEWIKWREEQADDLPAAQTLDEVWNNMPPLKEELIPGVLRVGHKMLVAGPSKAGKSFLLINLAIAIAEGREWLGMKCRQGKVVYVNLELDRASCFDRFKEIYDKIGIEPKHLRDITIWNLRGHAAAMDRLAPILIHRFKSKDYAAVIIDPIYKVITGDENNATEMSKFCVLRPRRYRDGSIGDLLPPPLKGRNGQICERRRPLIWVRCIRTRPRRDSGLARGQRGWTHGQVQSRPPERVRRADGVGSIRDAPRVCTNAD